MSLTAKVRFQGWTVMIGLIALFFVGAAATFIVNIDSSSSEENEGTDNEDGDEVDHPDFGLDLTDDDSEEVQPESDLSDEPGETYGCDRGQRIIGSRLGGSDILGGVGNDTIYSSLGGDNTISGGDGHDTIMVGNDGGSVFPGDVVYGGLGNDTIHFDEEDTVNGDAGEDVFVPHGHGGVIADFNRIDDRLVIQYGEGELIELIQEITTEGIVVLVFRDGSTEPFTSFLVAGSGEYIPIQSFILESLYLTGS